MIQPYAIDQRYILATGEIENYLVVRLPGGKETRAPIDLDSTKAIMKGSLNEPDPEQNPLPQEPSPPQVPQQEEQGEMVLWKELDDSILHPHLKQALVFLGTPPVLPMKNLEKLVQQVTERFSPEDWDKVAEHFDYATQPKPVVQASPPVPKPAPSIGTIQWADGSPIVPAARARARTVQKDEMGYPITNDGEVDPGELVGGSDTDEDGIGQF